MEEGGRRKELDVSHQGGRGGGLGEIQRAGTLVERQRLPPRPPAPGHRTKWGQVRTHMVGLQSRSLNCCGWVFSGLPRVFSWLPVVCGLFQ